MSSTYPSIITSTISQADVINTYPYYHEPVHTLQ
uniref:Uncharacterized protein n=1 Tax=viral metagenome TaxID=1070528 RepID=A0A6C0BMT4_9ZZZZ